MHGWLDDLISWRDQAETVVFDAVDWLRGETVELTESAKREWRNKVAELRAKAAQLDQASSDLESVRDLAYSISAEEAMKWDGERQSLNRMRSLYAEAFSLLDGAASALRSVGLGALPFALPLTVGGMAALIAASGAVIVSVYSAIQGWKAYAYTQRIEAGVPPAQASAEVEGEYPTAAGQAWSVAIPQTAAYVAMGLVAVFVLPQLMKGRR